MRVVLTLIGAVLLLCVALVALAPATLIDGELASATAGRIHMNGSEGTLWHGSGNLVLPGGFQQPISWQIDKASSIIAGELRGVLIVTNSAPGVIAPPSAFAVGPDRIHLERVYLNVPADALVRASGVAIPVSASGTVYVQLDTFDLAGKVATVKGTADWRGASLAAPGTALRLDVGDVQLSLAGSGTEIPGTVGNHGGDVALSGSLRWPVGRATSGQVTVTPRSGLDPDYAAGLNTALMMAGRPDGRGGYTLSWAAPP
jgi:hypothetical protein